MKNQTTKTKDKLPKPIKGLDDPELIRRYETAEQIKMAELLNPMLDNGESEMTIKFKLSKEGQKGFDKLVKESLK